MRIPADTGEVGIIVTVHRKWQNARILLNLLISLFQINSIAICYDLRLLYSVVPAQTLYYIFPERVL